MNSKIRYGFILRGKRMGHKAVRKMARHFCGLICPSSPTFAALNREVKFRPASPNGPISTERLGPNDGGFFRQPKPREKGGKWEMGNGVIAAAGNKLP